MRLKISLKYTFKRRGTLYRVFYYNEYHVKVLHPITGCTTKKPPRRWFQKTVCGKYSEVYSKSASNGVIGTS